jgi:hypothetical protein
MRIAVRDAARREQQAGLVERLGHRLVGGPLLADRRVDVEAGEQRHVRVVAAVLGHGVGHFHVIGDAELIVVRTVPRRDVHEARAGIRRHEGAGQQPHVEVVALAAQRMSRDQPLEILGGKVAYDLERGLDLLRHDADQLLGQH